jgi:hypothetical protein
MYAAVWAQMGGSLLDQSMTPVVTTVLLTTEFNTHCCGVMTVYATTGEIRKTHLC